MKKIKKFRKNREEIESGRLHSKAKRKKRLRPEETGRKKLLRHYFEEE